MSSYYPPEVSVVAHRPDLELSLPPRPRQGLLRRMWGYALNVGIFIGVTLLIAVLFYIPVLVLNLGQVEAVEVAGEHMSAALFAQRLGALFWGVFILALAFTSFIASVQMYDWEPKIRPEEKAGRYDVALTQLAMLRLLRPER